MQLSHFFTCHPNPGYLLGDDPSLNERDKIVYTLMEELYKEDSNFLLVPECSLKKVIYYPESPGHPVSVEVPFSTVFPEESYARPEEYFLKGSGPWSGTPLFTLKLVEKNHKVEVSASMAAQIFRAKEKQIPLVDLMLELERLVKHHYETLNRFDD